MLAVNFGDIGSSLKRDQCPITMEEDDTRNYDPSPMHIKRRRRLSDEGSPMIVNRMLQQHESELRELKLSLEKKDRELREKQSQIQMLQSQLSSSSSKIQQFDTLAKSFLEQNGKLKTKEEEVSSLTTVIQRLLAENLSLKNQLFLIDRQSMTNMFDP